MGYEPMNSVILVQCTSNWDILYQANWELVALWVRNIYINSWKVHAYSIYAQVLIQKQRVRKYRTKHFPCCNLFIQYLLRFSPSTRFSPFIRQNKCQVMFLFHLSASTLSLLQKPSVNIFCTECLPRHQSTLQLRLICFPCLAFF